MVSDLEQRRAQVGPGGEEGGLARRLRIADEERAEGAITDAEHQASIIAG